jgi:hypothetical protein
VTNGRGSDTFGWTDHTARCATDSSQQTRICGFHCGHSSDARAWTNLLHIRCLDWVLQVLRFWPDGTRNDCSTQLPVGWMALLLLYACFCRMHTTQLTSVRTTHTSPGWYRCSMCLHKSLLPWHTDPCCGTFIRQHVHALCSSPQRRATYLATSHPSANGYNETYYCSRLCPMFAFATCPCLSSAVQSNEPPISLLVTDSAARSANLPVPGRNSAELPE